MTQPEKQVPAVTVHPGLSPGTMRVTVRGALMKAGTDPAELKAFDKATIGVNDRVKMVKAMAPWATAVWGTAQKK